MEKENKKYVVIDDGKFSGKHPFARFVASSKTTIERLAKDNGYSLNNIIEVTEFEFAYINLVPNEIEILYNEESEGNRFFY